MMKTDICTAIDNQYLIELRYSGYSRTVEPHAYGREKSGDEILRCFQVFGGSESGEHKGWKLLKVRDVYSLHHTNIKFSIRPGYKSGDKAMEYIFCQV